MRDTLTRQLGLHGGRDRGITNRLVDRFLGCRLASRRNDGHEHYRGQDSEYVWLGMQGALLPWRYLQFWACLPSMELGECLEDSGWFGGAYRSPNTLHTNKSQAPAHSPAVGKQLISED